MASHVEALAGGNRQGSLPINRYVQADPYTRVYGQSRPKVCAWTPLHQSTGLRNLTLMIMLLEVAAACSCAELHARALP